MDEKILLLEFRILRVKRDLIIIRRIRENFTKTSLYICQIVRPSPGCDHEISEMFPTYNKRNFFAIFIDNCTELCILLPDLRITGLFFYISHFALKRLKNHFKLGLVTLYENNRKNVTFFYYILFVYLLFCIRR